ncbi:Dehydrosqualene desaturase [bioreactor metagenome]|uniref:Dehydrosqualene desaturase n=1 Tax=bioreactor metagenome TaxID=1076179 RepID=A0A644ZE82_9ZZZZ
MDKNTIIIGGGIGGLCSGIRLLSKGYHVTLLEKNKQIGGKINILKDNNFKFDLTASIIMTPKIYTDIFKDVGKNYEDYFKIHKLDPIYKVFYDDKTFYNFYSDTNKMINELENLQKGLSTNFFNFLSKSYEKYFISKDKILNQPMINLKEIINFSFIKSMGKINPLSSTNNYLNKLICNEKLKNYLIFTSMFIGVNPYTNSNIYTLIPTISHLYGLWYIEGGLYEYIKALEKLFIDMGGKIITNCEVKNILIENNQVKGVKTKYKVLSGDLIICNVDYPFAIKNLINDESLDNKYGKNNLKNIDYSCSVFILYLGLDKIYHNLNVHNIYISKDFKNSIEGPFRGYIPSDPSLYIYYPSAIDKSFKVNNHSSMNIMIRVPNLSFNNINYNNNQIKVLKKYIFNTLKNINGLESIESHVIYENYLTPLDLRDKYNLYYGNAFGISHKISQSAYFRPHLKSKKVKGLYFIGSSTHPGNGASVVIDGSKVLCDIIENNKK